MATLKDMQASLSAVIRRYASEQRLAAKARRAYDLYDTTENKAELHHWEKRTAITECELFDDYGLQVVDDIELSRCISMFD